MFILFIYFDYYYYLFINHVCRSHNILSVMSKEMAPHVHKDVIAGRCKFAAETTGEADDSPEMQQKKRTCSEKSNLLL